MHDPALKIRRAVASDAAGFARCLDAAYLRYRTRIPDLPDMSQGCAEEIADHQVWVVEHQNSIVAGLVLKPKDTFMMLANIAVSPEFAGRGIGRSLMDLCEDETARQGFASMRLNTHAGMSENISLYQRLGWTELNRDRTTVSMEKQIVRSQ